MGENATIPARYGFLRDPDGWTILDHETQQPIEINNKLQAGLTLKTAAVAIARLNEQNPLTG